ncbi:MAG: hypothetical protein ACYC56_07070 [Candidatus Aquicultor sp.]
MSKRAKVILISVIAIILVPTLILIAGLANPSLANTPILRTFLQNFSKFFLSHVDVITIPEGQNLGRISTLSPAKVDALKSGKVTILSALDISRKNFKEPTGLSSRFVIVTIDPVDLEGQREAERRRIITAVDDLGVQGKVDAIVEATASDIARANPWGFTEVKRLRDAGVLRCVILDGGHHIGSLPLMPDIILTPVLRYDDGLCASHWFTRDSAPIEKLRATLNNEGMDIIIAQFPRNGIPVKNPIAMGMLAGQAITKLTKTPTIDKGPPDRKQIAKPTQRSGNTARNHIKKGSLFVSFDSGISPTKEHILKVIKDIIKEKTRASEKTERVYVGITYGTSHFPHISDKVSFTTGELERYLNKRLPYKITVMSEPASTWDVYLHRIGLY